jgi:hypothetical protein
MPSLYQTIDVAVGLGFRDAAERGRLGGSDPPSDGQGISQVLKIVRDRRFLDNRTALTLRNGLYYRYCRAKTS